jgi:hypothetical protein
MTLLFECPDCLNLHSSIEWDNATLLGCNRKLRRHFKSLELSNNSKDFLYKCPSCLKYIPKYKIIKSYLNDDEIVKI